jgi:23S rRNA (cytosine1962-C5)-methyltransferase
MNILTTPGWDDYSLLDSGDGYRLEQFGKYRLMRPDPQIIWKRSLLESEWQKADAVFEKEGLRDAGWKKKTAIPAQWEMAYKNIRFHAKLSPFKHTGVFPEQHMQWDWMTEQLKVNSSTLKAENEQPKVLNLFAYTGLASLVAAANGAQVTHVDASRPTIGWARENQALSGLEDKPIRWILDDVTKFVAREVRRGNTYEGIILDPPVYGHGPTGEVWRFNDHVPPLLSLCRQLLSPNASFVIMNAYAISSSALMLENIFNDYFGDLPGKTEVGELVLTQKSGERPLSTGIFARWGKAGN